MSVQRITDRMGRPGIEFELEGKRYRSYPPYTVPWVTVHVRSGPCAGNVHERGLNTVGGSGKAVRAYLKTLVESGQIDPQQDIGGGGCSMTVRFPKVDENTYYSLKKL